ncbi:hypothetical protein RND71_031916 [Anisodus tanguticus]|uniref:Uncharacterized protein n=1 Tax=Anisodus tanguticus TaxID=243964 RepID=A0AAE1RDJ5_9SOLA|nr:hypothetical protein RND71_031916 [Anisodus tanguticus]
MDELPAKAEDTVKDCGVGPSGASSGYSDSAEKVPDFVILPNTNLVEINDDQITPIAPRRIDGLPSRYEVLLWHYGRQKQENGERNDFENPGRWRKQARGKKRKKKT